jgi:hypothetical protein
LAAAYAALFLCRVVLQRASAHGGQVIGDKIVDALASHHTRLLYVAGVTILSSNLLNMSFSAKNPFVVDPTDVGFALPANPNPLFADLFKPAPTPPPAAPKQPDIIPECPVFEVPLGAVRHQIAANQLTNWRSNPDPLLGMVFVSMTGADEDEEDEVETFLVHSYTTVAGGKKIFYLLFEGEDEAMGFEVDAFFALLKSAERVMFNVQL